MTARPFCLTEENPKTALKHYWYFLVRPEGNILFHPLKKTSLLKQHEPLFVERGGIKLQLLTHDAEASPSCEWVHERFGAGLYFHSLDAPQVARKTKCPVTFAFSSRHHCTMNSKNPAHWPHTRVQCLKTNDSRCDVPVHWRLLDASGERMDRKRAQTIEADRHCKSGRTKDFCF